MSERVLSMPVGIGNVHAPPAMDGQGSGPEHFSGDMDGNDRVRQRNVSAT